MVTVNPTYSDVAWGPDPWCFFDYYQNPTRITGGNPLLIIGPASGWNTRSHRSMRDSTISEMWYFMRYLLGAQDASATGDFLKAMPAECWDVCAMNFGQQKHDAAVIPRSISLYGMDVVRDYQRGVASIKALHATYGFNPSKVILAGSSSSALTAAISQLAPARLGSGGGKTWIDSRYGPNTYDSTARGVIFSEGPVDIRNSNGDNPPTGTDYFHYSRIAALLGVNSTDATEWNAVPASVKSALSVLAYFENEDLGGYPGMYALFRPEGDGVKPLGDASNPNSDPHDSIQLSDLRTAAKNAGVNVPCVLVTDGAWTNGLHNTAISARSYAIFKPLSDWMAKQIQ